MIEILTQYKELIAIAAAALFEIIVLLIVKKRPKIVDNSFIAHLCDWILEAENTYKEGDIKMDFVLDKAQKYLGKNFIASEVKTLTEYLLTIPQKKEKK